MSAVRVVSVLVSLLVIHHAQHLRAASFEETYHEQSGDDEKDNVEHRRIVEGDRCFDHLRAPLRGEQPQSLEQEFDH